jgi:hypothetical protein
MLNPGTVLRASVRETSGQDKGQLLHYHHSGSGKSCQSALQGKALKNSRGHLPQNMGLSHWRKKSNLWTGLVPLKFLDDVLLVRDVGLTALGSLTPATSVLVANLKIAHHSGA